MSIRKKIISILVLFAVMLSAFICAFNINKANAFSGRGELKEQSLYNATNTYNVDESLFSNEVFQRIPGDIENGIKPQYPIRYDMSVKNGKAVMDTAQITVLTHGLGANAGAWSILYSASNNGIESDNCRVVFFVWKT